MHKRPQEKKLLFPVPSFTHQCVAFAAGLVQLLPELPEPFFPSLASAIPTGPTPMLSGHSSRAAQTPNPTSRASRQGFLGLAGAEGAALLLAAALLNQGQPLVTLLHTLTSNPSRVHFLALGF